MPERRLSGNAAPLCATFLEHPMGASLVSRCSNPRARDLTGQFDLGDDAASWVRSKCQATLPTIERREPGARVGQPNTGAKTLRKSDSVVDHGHAKSFGQTLGSDGDRSSLRQ